MAENKNSFVFYTDWEDTFRALPKDKGYDLLIHMLDYVNDRNPETDDLLINAVFQQLKNTLKRDLKGYEEKKEERSNSGRLGNLKRYHPDLYKKVSSEKLTLEAAEKVAISRKASLSDKAVAKLAVSDSVSVNVSDSDILLKKETKYVVDDEVENIEKISEFKNFLKTEKQIQMDRLRMAHKLSDQELDLKIDEFVEKKVSWGDDEKWLNTNDMAKNFEFWLNKYPKIQVSSFKDWNKQQFFENISTSAGTVSKEVKQDFFNHYSQPTASGEMLFQSFNAWDTKTRMKKWINSQNKFANVS